MTTGGYSSASSNRPLIEMGRVRVSRSVAYVAVARLISLALILVIWQALAGGPRSVLPTTIVGKPTTVASMFWKLLVQGTLLSAAETTMKNLVISLLIAAPLGIAIGILLSPRPMRWLLEPALTILYAVPKIALITIYILVLGIGTKAHVWLVVGAALFVYYFATVQALRELDRDRMTALRLMGAGPLKVGRAYVLPASLPLLLAATRIAVPLAFTTEIFAELRIPGASGLGVLLSNYEQFVEGSAIMAILLFVVFFAYLFDILTAYLLSRYAQSTGTGVQF